jgi:hypothetical protein
VWGRRPSAAEPPMIDKRWSEGPRVRVASLRKGDRVLTISGEVETYERPHTSHGVFCMEGGALYAGSAEVVRLRK